MMSEADDTAKKMCDAMVAEHSKRAGYFQSGEVHKYRLKDTLWVERHHKDVLSRHWQQSWHMAGVILWKTGQDVYVIQVGNNKTEERDHTPLLPREPDPNGRAVTFEFTADVFDSENDRGGGRVHRRAHPLAQARSQHAGGTAIQGPMERFCCIEGLVGTAKQH